MIQQAPTLMPPVGTEVQCYFLGNAYRGVVTAHGRLYPHVRFVLKNRRVVRGRATVIGHDDPVPYSYRGMLARLYFDARSRRPCCSSTSPIGRSGRPPAGSAGRQPVARPARNASARRPGSA